jgi:Phage tail lysozyme
LLCVLPDVTAADPRVQTLKRYVLSRGPLINWPAVPTANRLVYVMERLIQIHHYPVNGAAGIVGNVFAESGAIPSRIEGSAAETPLRSANFAGQQTDFRPEEVQDRSGGARPPVGPQKPGVGLAQWTTGSRRSGLFQQTAPEGRHLGSSILFNMDAQVDYLVTELQARTGLNGSLTNAGVAVDNASDNVVYDFEIPASVLDASGHKLPRSDPKVVTEFTARRGLAHRALQAYQAAHHGP